MQRRRFIQFAGTGIIAGAAGCSGSSSGPKPSVEDVTAEGQLIGEADFDVLVSNDGESGEILVTLTLYDGSDSELDSESRKTTLEGGDTTQVTISMDVPDEAEYYEATAESL